MALRRYAEAEREFDLALAVEPSDYDVSVYKAWSSLLAGNPLPQITKALWDIPRNSVQTYFVATLQFEISWMSRQPEAALEALDGTTDWVSATNAIGREPVELLRAQAWALKGDGSRAQQAYKEAHSMLKDALLDRPEDSSLWSFLGLAEAGLDQKQEAIRASLRAINLTPVSKDALNGPSYLVTLAKIYVRMGEPAQALKLLRQLLVIPAGLFISVSLLNSDPVWDPIRNDPRFQRLLKEYADKLPVPELDVADILSFPNRSV